ncbi:hypothetical protein LEP1GSC125_3033 [Leptospira mayottensis 200901122]|uniref:Uncharacterized protein n=1 Tax=Leptospira mayottensis 200901122 TaxID=1193010 RepID=A0AA87SZ03_9LEPT|nr:hypothetical protein LEP1GSC125_3033 [Leptospira mayottensis 200901122]
MQMKKGNINLISMKRIINQLRACPKTYFQDILIKMIANAIWNNAL